MQKNIWVERIRNVLASRWCMIGITALLVLESVWIALSGLYPMAFDEDFHLGIIKLYAHHGVLPFWSGQPANAGTYGAVARDPSYLYHYLMSFPYRLLAQISSSTMFQVLGLRAISIALFAYGLVLWRKLLLKTGASPAAVHACLAFFVLIPAVPLLAAQINYDNLLFPVIAGLLLLVLRFQSELAQKRVFNLNLFVTIASISLLASLIKYAFLPILVAIVLYLLWQIIRSYTSWHQFGHALQHSWTSMSRLTQIGLVIALLLSCGMFFERYGINMLDYHTPVPDCGQVLSYDECSAYGPWIRDYNLEQTKVVSTSGPLSYADDWLHGMWLRLFFAVDGPTTGFQTRGPLTVPALSAVVFAVIGLLAAVVYRKRVWRLHHRPALNLFAVVTVLYVGILYLDGYRRFAQTGQPVAINGRYLIPVLLFLLLIAVLGVSQAARKLPAARASLFIIAFCCLAWGGGAMTYILRSSDTWYWQSTFTRPVNHQIQRTLGPVTPGYNHPTQYL